MATPEPAVAAPPASLHANRHNYFYLAGLIIISALCLVGIYTLIKWYKSYKSVFVPLLVGIFSASVLGAVDALFFLTTESELDEYLEKIGLPSKITPLIVGAISACLSLIVSNYAETLFAGMESTKSMWLDVLGIFIGTVVISVIYVTYLSFDV